MSAKRKAARLLAIVVQTVYIQDILICMDRILAVMFKADDGEREVWLSCLIFVPAV